MSTHLCHNGVVLIATGGLMPGFHQKNNGNDQQNYNQDDSYEIEYLTRLAGSSNIRRLHI
jgi:hypothetical protein